MGVYTGNYSNPSPALAHIPIVLGISFKDPLTGASFKDDALIDTGADFSTIPSWFISQYNLSPTNKVAAALPDGKTQQCYAYTLEVTVPGLTATSEEFIDYGFNEIILGRPILNNWMITLDPAHKNPGGAGIRIQD